MKTHVHVCEVGWKGGKFGVLPPEILTSYTIFTQVLEKVKVKKEMDRDTLINVARTSLRTKVHTELADLLTEVHVILILEKNLFN